MPKTREILDLNFFSNDRDSLLNLLSKNLSTSKTVVLTPNPEILLLSENNSNLRNCLLTADVNLLDGVGIQLAQFILRKKLAPRHPGRLVLEDLLRVSEKNGLKVFFLGSNDKVLSDLRKKLGKSHPGLDCEFSSGSILNNDGLPSGAIEEKKQNEAIQKINKFAPHFIFVAFGAPKQELWVKANRERVNAKVFMVVGGSLDYLSGNTIQVPDFVSKIGLEWLVRLIGQPRRVVRIVNATVVFLSKVIYIRLRQP